VYEQYVEHNMCVDANIIIIIQCTISPNSLTLTKQSGTEVPKRQRGEGLHFEEIGTATCKYRSISALTVWRLTQCGLGLDNNSMHA